MAPTASDDLSLAAAVPDRDGDTAEAGSGSVNWLSGCQIGATRGEQVPGSTSPYSLVYLTSVSILNIGRYIEITIVPTIAPTPIIRIGSMIEVSDWMLESTSSS